MIRIIYRWRVEPEQHEDFGSWWHDGTLRIRASQPGALGSTLCRSAQDPNLFLGIARWESRAAVEAFWKMGGSQFEGARLVSTEMLDELDNLTV